MLVPNFDGYWLDHAATTPDLTPPMEHVDWANSHSLHTPGIAANLQAQRATSQIKEFLGGPNGHIFWFGSGSQANNFAIKHLSDDILTTTIEHKSILQHITEYDHKLDCDKFGIVSLDNISKHLEKKNKLRYGLTSIQMVNNETGVVQDIEGMSRLIKSKNPDIVFHTDAVQAFGKMPINVTAMGVDALTFSAHKFYGPKGLGGLWVSQNIYEEFEWPYMGTIPTELVCKVWSSISNINVQGVADAYARKDHAFITTLLTTQVECNHNSTYNRMVGIFSLHFRGVDAIDLMQKLSDKKVYVGLGSACNSKDAKPSHVLKAMGQSKEQIMSTIRVSTGRAITEEQCKEAALIIAETVKELRNGSKS